MAIMVDLETFGTGRDAAIASIGAVEFDPVSGWMGPQFHVRVDLNRSRSPGVLDVGSVEFWLRQPRESQARLLEEPRETLGVALQQFSDFVAGKEMWSNAPTFDEIILRDAFLRHDMKFPCGFRQSRDYRTLIRTVQARGFEKPPREEFDRHDALADSVWQAKVVISAFHFLGLS